MDTNELHPAWIAAGLVVFGVAFFAAPPVDEIIPRGLFASGSGWGFLYSLMLGAVELLGPFVLLAVGLLFVGVSLGRIAAIPILAAGVVIGSVGAAYFARFVLGWVHFLAPFPPA